MTIEISDFLWLMAAYAFIWYWWNAKGAKEQALNATRKRCRELELQLLDDSIALRAFWLKRNNNGRLSFWRSYNFEFSSTGADRYNGQIIILGKRIEAINLEAHRVEG